MCLTCKWWFPIGQGQEWCFDGSTDSAQDLLCLVDSLPVWPMSILAENHTFTLKLTTACSVFHYEASYLEMIISSTSLSVTVWMGGQLSMAYRCRANGHASTLHVGSH